MINFSKKALKYLVEISEAESILKEIGADYKKFKLGRGIIGALAAIGYEFEDSTYELISYRNKSNWGSKRRLNKESVYEMNKKTFPKTFNNLDTKSKKILITPIKSNAYLESWSPRTALNT